MRTGTWYMSTILSPIHEILKVFACINVPSRGAVNTRGGYGGCIYRRRRHPAPGSTHPAKKSNTTDTPPQATLAHNQSTSPPPLSVHPFVKITEGWERNLNRTLTLCCLLFVVTCLWPLLLSALSFSSSSLCPRTQRSVPTYMLSSQSNEIAHEY